LAGRCHNAPDPIGKASKGKHDMAVIGYARTSTQHQGAGLDARLRQPRTLGCDTSRSR
jgi:hypothetical protein